MVDLYQQVNGNHDRCPICKKSPETCPHSLTQMDKKVWENWVRKIVRAEIQAEARRQQES